MCSDPKKAMGYFFHNVAIDERLKTSFFPRRVSALISEGIPLVSACPVSVYPLVTACRHGMHRARSSAYMHLSDAIIGRSLCKNHAESGYSSSNVAIYSGVTVSDYQM